MSGLSTKNLRLLGAQLMNEALQTKGVTMKDYSELLNAISYATDLKTLHKLVGRLSFKNNEPNDWLRSSSKILDSIRRWETELIAIEIKINEARQHVKVLHAAVDRSDSFNH